MFGLDPKQIAEVVAKVDQMAADIATMKGQLERIEQQLGTKPVPAAPQV